MPRVPTYTRHALRERMARAKLANERITPETIVADVLPLSLLAELFEASVLYVRGIA